MERRDRDRTVLSKLVAWCITLMLPPLKINSQKTLQPPDSGWANSLFSAQLLPPADSAGMYRSCRISDCPNLRPAVQNYVLRLNR